MIYNQPSSKEKEQDMEPKDTIFAIIALVRAEVGAACFAKYDGTLHELEPRDASRAFFKIVGECTHFSARDLVKVNITREEYNRIKGIANLPKEVQDVLNASKYKDDKGILGLLQAVDAVYKRK